MHRVIQLPLTGSGRACECDAPQLELERQSLLLPVQESRTLDPALRRDPKKRESDLRQRRMSLWLKEKDAEIETLAEIHPRASRNSGAAKREQLEE